jgi:hypothetical protein
MSVRSVEDEHTLRHPVPNEIDEQDRAAQD